MLTLLLCFTLTKSYYLSPNVFTFEQGRQFCQNQCKSDLSSIHDIYDFEQAITTISDSQLIFNNTAHILIGLYSPQSSNTFQWYDDTSFDFGSNLNGSYPWDTSYPSRPNTAQRCVVLNAQNSYRWNDIDCDVKHPVLCDHCDGILNKYIIAANPSTLWEDVKSECVSIGSTLASMHSARDFEELRTLCAITDFQYCWIGLYEPDRDEDWRNAINLDNTSFDFGFTLRQYPWDNNQPDISSQYEYTVWLEKRAGYLLHDVGDEGYSNLAEKVEGLCNMPSALCDIQDNGWTDMSVIGDGCELLSISDGYQSAVWTEYEWYNGNGILRMDVNMKMNFNANALYPETGFNLESCSGSTYSFMISRGDTEDALFIGYNDYVFVNVSLPFNIDRDIYYALSVNIENVFSDHEEDALLFNVSLLDVQYISHYQRLSDIPLQNGEDKPWQINTNGTGGYIGVYTLDTSTHFKSVYVSGTRIETVPLELCATADPTDAPSRSPSDAPTSAPTAPPTAHPSVVPSDCPTSNPSPAPTDDPTPAPTDEPTAPPTADPTTDPTTDPTADPTTDPTVDPTLYPTVDPTVEPTVYPTKNPTIPPTTDPSTYPTKSPTLNPTPTGAVTTNYEVKIDITNCEST